MSEKIEFVDVTLRDGNQSLFAKSDCVTIHKTFRNLNLQEI